MGIPPFVFGRTQDAKQTPFDPTGSTLVSTDVEAAIKELTTLANLPIFALTLQHNGSVGGNTFLGYNELIPGDATPVIVPRKSQFIGFTFSNNSALADFKLEFRKNSSVATPFYTTASKVDTQFFAETLGTPESFNLGDQIYVKYIDEGQNASDVGMSLSFKAVP